DLIEAALPHCTELRFLNPGIETCVAHCNRRPWEASKFSCAEQQNAMLGQLIQWVKEYETRNDEYGLKRHRQSFDNFSGTKRADTTTASFAGSPRTAAAGRSCRSANNLMRILAIILLPLIFAGCFRSPSSSPLWQDGSYRVYSRP